MDARSTPPAAAALQRTQGLLGLTLYGVGTVVGAGVYSVIGPATAHAGAALWQAFVAAAVVACLAALSYAELAAAVPHAGAEYGFLRRALPHVPAVAFLVGCLLLVSAAATAATVALAFARSLQLFVDVPVGWAAAALLVGVGALASAGLVASGRANAVLTCIELAGLALVVTLGARQPGFGDALQAAPHLGVLTATAVVFFVYLGFENIVTMSEEVRGGPRTVAWALLLTMAVTTVAYLAVALAVVALAPPAELAATEAALAHGARRAAPWAGDAVAAITLASTTNTCLITLLAAGRIGFAMARERDLPPALTTTTPRRRSPWLAVVAVAVTGLLLLPLGGVEATSRLASLTSLLAFASVHVAVVLLRLQAPDLPRPFRLWGRTGRWPLVPVLGLAATVPLLARFGWVEVALAAGAGGLALALRRWLPR